MYGGIDDDVRRMFFALEGFTLKLVFNRYRRVFWGRNADKITRSRASLDRIAKAEDAAESVTTQ